MKWTGMYLVGYLIFVGGVVAALWKVGLLERIGTTWTVIGLVIAAGIGVMLAVSGGGAKQVVEINRS
ncbi:MAG: hypothetical protein ACRETN_09120 [Nevskiales bacterium]